MKIPNVSRLWRRSVVRHPSTTNERKPRKHGKRELPWWLINTVKLFIVVLLPLYIFLGLLFYGFGHLFEGQFALSSIVIAGASLILLIIGIATPKIVGPKLTIIGLAISAASFIGLSLQIQTGWGDLIGFLDKQLPYASCMWAFLLVFVTVVGSTLWLVGYFSSAVGEDDDDLDMNGQGVEDEEEVEVGDESAAGNEGASGDRT